jgi:ATP-dependent protease Clp ATPase subunit
MSCYRARPSTQVRGKSLTIIAGPHHNHICDECIDVCAEIVAKKRASEESK